MTRLSPPEAEPRRGWNDPAIGRFKRLTRLGKYWLLDELGSGGMAVVYLGVMRGMNAFTKLVVLKTLRPHMVESPEATQMFMTEARLTARLNHPNIVQTYEATEDDGLCTIVMEFLEGRSLEDVMAAAPADGRGLVLNLKILMGALRGLHHAHELVDFDGAPLAVVHRDISPHNIFATFDGQAKVLDFGIAKLSQSQHTETGVIKGKVRYMSPEQAGGEDVDRRTDIFAAGVILWEILTRHRLWDGKNDLQVFQCLLAEKSVPSPRSVDPSVNPALERVCMRALAFDRNERFENCEAMHDEIAEALAALPAELRRLEPAELLDELFGAERQRHRAHIAELMAELNRQEKWDLRSPSLTPGPLKERAPEVEAEVAPVAKKWDSSKLYFLAAVLGAALIALGLWSLRSPKEEPKAPSASAAAPALMPPPDAVVQKPAASSAAKEDFVTIAITVDPSSATLSWDGVSMGGNSIVRREPRGSGSHTVEVSAKGYVSETLRVDTSRDHDLTFALKPDGSSRRAGVRQSAPRAPRVKPAAGARPAGAENVSSRPTAGSSRPTLDTDSPW